MKQTLGKNWKILVVGAALALPLLARVHASPTPDGGVPPPDSQHGPAQTMSGGGGAGGMTGSGGAGGIGGSGGGGSGGAPMNQ